MKIRMIDAYDAFSMGGVFDLQTGKYIAPKFFSEAHPANNTGIDEEGYALINADPSRYMRTPILRPTGLACATAMQMGMTKEYLVRCGMNRKEYWDFFQPRKENPIDAFPYLWSEEEWAIRKAIEKWMLASNRYLEYDAAHNKNAQKIIRTWFHARGLEVVDE